MIVKMMKVFLVARSSDRDRLLETIRELGAVHLAPADPRRATADEATLARIAALERAVQMLSGIAPTGEPPALSPEEAADEALDIQRRTVERRNRLAALYHQLEQFDLWGNVELQQFEVLREAGIEVRFYAVPRAQVHEVQADCVQVVGDLPGRRSLVAAADRSGRLAVPEEAEEVPLPPRDAPAIRREAAQLDAAIRDDARRLAELAHLVEPLRHTLVEMQDQADYLAALRGAVGNDHLFAVQGWAPVDQVERFAPALREAGIPAAIEALEARDDEQPPTLIRPPAWTRPIEGLFKMLGTVAGYREFDVSVPFLIALPIFTAMLISDGGYGAVLLLGLILGYGKATRLLGKQFTHLMLIVSAVALAYGFVCNSFFGFPLKWFAPLIPVDLTEHSRFLLMRIAFTMGAIHLSVAQLWPAVRIFPDLRFLNRVGWAVFIWGMYGVVQFFVLKAPFTWETPWPYLLLLGGSLAILFHAPSTNLLKMLGLGVANFPLSMLSSFSDVISYVRLMAVGLASSVLALNFNEMALKIEILPLTILILVFGHALNLGLALIAMFAHGVRLNMLEFCNNLGMQWTGYAYRPFLKRTSQEYGS